MMFVRMCAGYKLYGHSEPQKEEQKEGCKNLEIWKSRNQTALFRTTTIKKCE
jgi:hypothetical protein